MAIVTITLVLRFLWCSTTSTLSLFVDSGTTDRMPPTSPLSTGTPFLDPGIDHSLSKARGRQGFLPGLWPRVDVEIKINLNLLASRTEPVALSFPNTIWFLGQNFSFLYDFILMTCNCYPKFSCEARGVALLTEYLPRMPNTSGFDSYQGIHGAWYCMSIIPGLRGSHGKSPGLDQRGGSLTTCPA